LFYLILNFQNEVAVNYMRGTNFMMLGGLMLATCVEHSGLHRRIALRIVLLMGTSPKMAMFGFMATTAFVSMFISNAASTAMMVPIVEAFAEVSDQQSDNVGFILQTFLK
jgi:sodium-dependent dicarboxylate transporter 2/3/5